MKNFVNLQCFFHHDAATKCIQIQNAKEILHSGVGGLTLNCQQHRVQMNARKTITDKEAINEVAKRKPEKKNQA